MTQMRSPAETLPASQGHRERGDNRGDLSLDYAAARRWRRGAAHHESGPVADLRPLHVGIAPGRSSKFCGEDNFRRRNRRNRVDRPALGRGASRRAMLGELCATRRIDEAAGYATELALGSDGGGVDS